MTAYFQDDSLTLHLGDALEVLKSLPDKSVDCCVTSPPYFGLRDYGQDGQYGLEATPAEYVNNMCAAFGEVRRVLTDDGTLWLNIGDSYSSNAGWGRGGGSTLEGRKPSADQNVPRNTQFGLPPKNLLGIPWRLAFALQDDGWTLRNDIIWSKANSMPEAVSDRLSSKHEHVFMFTKARRYWFDLGAIREEPASASISRAQGHRAAPGKAAREGRSTAGIASPNTLALDQMNHPAGKNPGDVWTLPTQPFAQAHFAVMPLALAERCIQAGCTPKRCVTCDHAPEPVTARGGMDMSRPQARRAMEIATEHGLTEEHFAAIRSGGVTDTGKAAVTQSGTGRNSKSVANLAFYAKSVLKGYYREFLLDRLVTTGWTDCGHDNYRAGVVLDPFSGSGTTGLAAARNGRTYVGIDLSREYLDLSLSTRLAQPAFGVEGIA